MWKPCEERVTPVARDWKLNSKSHARKRRRVGQTPGGHRPDEASSQDSTGEEQEAAHDRLQCRIYNRLKLHRYLRLWCRCGAGEMARESLQFNSRKRNAFNDLN